MQLALQVRCVMMGDLDVRNAVRDFKVGQRQEKLLGKHEADAKRAKPDHVVQGLRMLAG